MKLLVALLLSGLILSLLVASGFAAPCPKCGKDVPADARFCGECGAKVDKPWEHPGTKAGEEITGPDGGKMVWVPAGEFLMGCNHSDKDSGLSDFPVHRVRLTRGFWLSKCVVTFGQWKRYCRTAKVAGPPLIYAPGDDYPVPGIGCAGAEAYCRFYGLALPTEAQWEYAARGPESRKYPWGNQWDP